MKTLFLLFSLSMALNCFGQYDQIRLTGQKDFQDCSIVDVTQASISYRLMNDKTVSTRPAKDVDKIRLHQGDGAKEAYTTNDLFNSLINKDSRVFVWMGLDFSRVTICHPGSENKYNTVFFNSINNFVTNPSGEFATLWKPNPRVPLAGLGHIDINPVTVANNEVNFSKIFFCNTNPEIPLDSIRESLKNLDIADSDKGIGIIFFYNEINKGSEKYSVYLVFFDIHSRNVLLYVRNDLKGDGITMEWHWTRQLLTVISNLRNPMSPYYRQLVRIFD